MTVPSANPTDARAARPLSPWRHLPNALTGARMLLVLPLFRLILDARFDAALLIAAIAGASDALDGFLAKHFGWQSWLGGMLDPIADKLMLIACFIALGSIGAQPDWLTWLVVGRDVIIVAGAVAYHNLVGPITAKPTLLSKITTCIQIAYVLIQLVHLTTWFELPRWLLLSTLWIVAASTALSGAQYVVLWSLKALREKRYGHAGEKP